uniref:Uncharacterized protein n=1 Tax=Acrobeloides nanus TaxID=290746 RepID=A0A914DXB2_9BILA
MTDTDIRYDCRGVALVKAKSHVSIPSTERRGLATSGTVSDLTAFLLRNSYKSKPSGKYHDSCDYRRVTGRGNAYLNDKYLYSPSYWDASSPRRKVFSEYVYSPFYKLNNTPQPKGYWHDFNDPNYYRRYLNSRYGDYMRDTFRANGSHWSAYTPSSS